LEAASVAAHSAVKEVVAFAVVVDLVEAVFREPDSYGQAVGGGEELQQDAEGADGDSREVQ
jgi:hypothetical protein